MTDQTAETAENRKNRTNQFADDIVDLLNDFADRLTEMNVELDMPATEIHQVVRERLMDKQDELMLLWWQAWGEIFPVAKMRLAHGEPMKQLIGRLFEEAPKMTDASGKAMPGQSPAMPDVILTLKCGQQLSGALSTTPEGTLRMMTPNEIQTQHGNKKVMVEQFFDYADVAMIAVLREHPQIATSRIISG